MTAEVKIHFQHPRTHVLGAKQECITLPHTRHYYQQLIIIYMPSCLKYKIVRVFFALPALE